MKTNYMKSALTAFLLFFLLTFDLFSQQADGSMFVDTLFNEYIALEDSLLLRADGSGFNEKDLVELENLMLKAEEAGRADIQSRIDMLSFVVATEIEAARTETESGTILKGISDSERKKRNEGKAEKTAKTFMGISVGTAILSGSIFAVSALASSNYYGKYTETEYADQAAFYLFWWQLLEQTAFVSALTTAAASLAAGILAAVM